MNRVFIEHLPTTFRGVDWVTSKGQVIPFIYKDIKGQLLLVEYNQEKKSLTVSYCQKEYEILTSSLLKCRLGKVVGTYGKDFSYDVGCVIQTKSGEIEITKREVRQKSGISYRWYKYQCLSCPNEDWIVESSLNKRSGCNVCCSPSKKILVGYNDIKTVAPEIYELMANKEDNKVLHLWSGKPCNFICPNCRGHVTQSVSDVYRQGLSCKLCSDGVSYPEKFVGAIMNFLNIECKRDIKQTWSENCRYDFYIPSLNMIIETHGLQHYEESNRGRSLKEEQENDLLKFDLANENGVKHYIVLDCRHSNPDWIKNSIMSSKLPELLGFKEEDIDWVECNKCSLKTLVKKACVLKKNNSDLTTTQIGNLIGVSNGTVREYLKKGSALGWCNYDSKEEQRKNASRQRENRKNRILGGE